MIGLIIGLFLCLNYLIVNTNSNRVLELNDKFIDLYKKDSSRAFIIKFYAPWCYHCQQLEPIWAQVAQQLHNLDQNIFVARVDCTKFSAIASHFSIKGFPTILYVNANKKIEYRGDRNKEDIIEFAKRVNGPPIRRISDCKHIESLQKTHSVFFTEFGETVNENYSQLAESYQSYDWYYHLPSNCSAFSNGIYVFKSPNFYLKYDKLDSELKEWVKFQRFAQFVKITPANLHLLLQTNKYLVIALIEEYKEVQKFANSKHEQFFELMEAIAYTYPSNNSLLIGWTSELSTFNSIAIRTISPLPNIIVLNSTTLQYYVNEGELLPQNVISLLDKVKQNSNELAFSGGDSLWHRFQRIIFDTFTSLASMYTGNPVLTLLLIGLPLSFLSIIIYTTCFSDILDAKDDDPDDEDEDSPEKHEKRD